MWKIKKILAGYVLFFFLFAFSSPASALILVPEIIELPLLLELDLGIVNLSLDLDLVVTGTPVPNLTVTPQTQNGITMTATNITVLNATNLGAKLHLSGTPLVSGTFYFDVKASNLWGSDTERVCVTVKVPTVSVNSVSLSSSSLSLNPGNTSLLTYTINPANATNKAVTWSSSNTAVATVDSNGLVTAVAIGTSTITATTQDGSKTATCGVTVTAGSTTVSVTGVTLSAAAAALSVGDTKLLTATVQPPTATNQAVTWSTTSPDIASVTQGGLVTALSPGTTTISVTTADGGFVASCDITVNPVPVTGVAVSPLTLSIPAGGSASLTYMISPSNATNKAVTWSSNNTAVAAVNANGVVTATGVGNATITATTQDGGLTANCTVTVTASGTGGGLVTKISLSASNLNLNVGDTQTLAVSITPSNADNQTVSWSTSNAGVVSVDQNGLVTAIGAGTATITASAQDGSGVTASCTINVGSSQTTIPVNGVTLSSGASGPLNVGDTRTLTVTFNPSNASNQTVYWSSSNPNVATVVNGVITGVGAGTATITVTTQDGGKQATYTITVQALGNTPVSQVDVYPSVWSMDIGATKLLSYTITPSTATSKDVTWSSGNTAIASVDQNGLVTALATGSVVITATAQDGSGRSSSCSITVSAQAATYVAVQSVDVSPSTLSLGVGGTRLLGVAIAPENATSQNITWSSSNPSVATVDSHGLVVALKAGSATITARASNNVTGTCAVTVSPPGGSNPGGGDGGGGGSGSTVSVTGVTLSPANMTLGLGQIAQLLYAITPANATNKAVDWSSSNPAVVSVDSTGKVTALSIGTAIITIATGDGGNEATCVITVAANGGSSVQGVTLSLSELSVAVGATRQLTATITPADAANKIVSWFSDNVNVATVDANGLIRGVGIGTANVTVITHDGGKQATCKVAVTGTTSRSSSSSGCDAGFGAFALIALAGVAALRRKR